METRRGEAHQMHRAGAKGRTTGKRLEKHIKDTEESGRYGTCNKLRGTAAAGRTCHQGRNGAEVTGGATGRGASRIRGGAVGEERQG